MCSYYIFLICVWFISGSTIQACRATRRHILAFEEDKLIFDALIAPVMRKTMVPPEPTQSTPSTFDVDEEVVVPDRIVKTARFSK